MGRVDRCREPSPPSGVGPPVGASSKFGVCRFCHGPTQPGYGRCYCCATVAAHLGMPLAPVVAVTTYRLGDEMHRLLRRYKDAPLAQTRHRSVGHCALLLAAFVDQYRQDLQAFSGGPWDTVVTVPSSRRSGGSPVDAVVSEVSSLAVDHRRLLVRGPGHLDHLQPSRSGFVVDSSVGSSSGGRRRVLVVDDSYTTGARAQSAATALRLAGMQVGAILVLGRVVAPRSCPWHAAFWAAHLGDQGSGHRVGCKAPG
jgi:predicted amidophosphoribosyltransferase